MVIYQYKINRAFCYGLVAKVYRSFVVRLRHVLAASYGCILYVCTFSGRYVISENAVRETFDKKIDYYGIEKKNWPTMLFWDRRIVFIYFLTFWLSYLLSLDNNPFHTAKIRRSRFCIENSPFFPSDRILLNFYVVSVMFLRVYWILSVCVIKTVLAQHDEVNSSIL